MNERGNSILRGLDLWLGVPVTFPAALYRRFSKPVFHIPSSPRIGILCMGAIGDALLLSALLKGIRARTPDAWLEFMGTNANSGAIPLLPEVDSHFVCPVTSPARLVGHMRSRRFDILFDAGQWARIGALACSLSSAGLTVGFQTSRQYRSLPYDIRVRHMANRHEVENFLELGRIVWPDLHGSPGLALPEWRKASGAPIYCHFWPAPGKMRHLKQWPEELWVRFAEAMLERGHKLVLTGSRQDSVANENFLNKYFRGERNMESIAGQASLEDLARLFTRACAVVSVNTGIMHLGALAGAPTVGLHGATNPLRWGPVGSNSISLLPERGECAYLNLGFEYPVGVRNAMGAISVASVEAALDSLGVRP